MGANVHVAIKCRYLHKLFHPCEISVFGTREHRPSLDLVGRRVTIRYGCQPPEDGTRSEGHG
jgi:hypothetical protein